ncbi:MAG TPA: TRAP transporter large permease [Syntrophorhabdaceae bacterium]|nr:TRAP transporter large permease [Syntrophorhabdaceae bacterium]
MNDPITVGIVGLIIVLFLFLTGIELGFAMVIMGFLGFGYLISFSAAFNLLAKDMYDVLNSYSFTVIPLFVLMGQVAFNSGIAKRLFDAAHKFIGHIPGGLAMATVGGATVFKAICGSSPATSATFASVAVPEMDRFGYDKRLSTGIVATVGTLGILLPPSVTLILYGIITDQSIGRLFLAGIVPGLVIAALFIGVIYGWCKMNPAIGPASPKATWGERFKTIPQVIMVLIIFFLVIGGILGGVFTPTEAGSVGTFLVLVMTFAMRDLNIRGYIKSVAESVRTATMVLMLIAGSTVLGHFIAVTTIPMVAADWIVSLNMPSWVIIVFIALIYLIGGSFIDDLAFMILATPIFYPAILKLGYDPMWFGILIGITVMLGVVLPPMAICVFVVKQITKTPFSVVYAGVYPFLISIIVGGILVFIFPALSTWLPHWLMPG